MYEEVTAENQDLRRRISSSEDGGKPQRPDSLKLHRRKSDQATPATQDTLLEVPPLMKSRSSPDGQVGGCRDFALKKGCGLEV